MAKVKIKGSRNVTEAEVSGLAEAKRGTDQGAGKAKTLHGGIPSKESRNPNPYKGISKKFRHENSSAFGEPLDMELNFDKKEYESQSDE